MPYLFFVLWNVIGVRMHFAAFSTAIIPFLWCFSSRIIAILWKTDVNSNFDMRFWISFFNPMAYFWFLHMNQTFCPRWLKACSAFYLLNLNFSQLSFLNLTKVSGLTLRIRWIPILLALLFAINDQRNFSEVWF